MSARNVYHAEVVAALTASGWVVTDDPLHLTFGERDLYVDLGLTGSALIAERAGRTIAVEIQSFVGRSAINDLHRAVGQYMIYSTILKRVRPEVRLYVAVHEKTFRDVFADDLGQLVLQDLIQRVIVFNPADRRIVQWID